MDSFPRQIRSEDEVYFRKPVPLAPISFGAKWWLGLKIVIAAQVLYFPFRFVFALDEFLQRRAPTAVESDLGAATMIGLLFLSILLGPLWAAALVRHGVASATGQRFIRAMVLPASDDKP